MPRRRRSVLRSVKAEPLEPRTLLTRLVGLDVSEFQGSINWNSVFVAGKRFAFIRASYGNNSEDANFSTNATNSVAAGMKVGYYHYAYYDLSGHTPTLEADNFWNTIKNDIDGSGKYLMPVLDVEQPGDPANGQTLSQWINSWCDRVISKAAAAGLTVTPMVYCNISDSDRLVGGGGAADSVTEHRPLWLARWPSGTVDTQNDQPDMSSGSAVVPWQHATDPFSYSCWSFWQYSAHGSVSGISGQVDLDVFQGDSNVLKDYTVNSAGRWAVGTRVQVTRADGTLNVFNTQDANDTILGTQAAGKQGTIIDGPFYGNSFMRWQVDFDTGKDGWVAEYQSVDPSTLDPIEWLSTISPSASTSPNPSNNAVTNTLPTNFAWTDGANATSYKVYLDGTLKSTVSDNSWPHTSISNGAHTWRVDSLNGELTTTGTTWNFTYDTVAPTASYGAQTPTNGSSTMDFTVTYADATSLLNASTFDSSDVTVTGPNSFNGAATFISVNTPGNGTPRTVTYRINGPGGTWDFGDNGAYTVSQNANQVADTAGNTRAAGSIGNFTVSFPGSATPGVPDLLDASDTGSSNSDNRTKSNASALQFSVGSTVSGATVKIYSDGNLIGTGTGNGSAITIAANTSLADGQHNITATQIESGRPESVPSAALAIVIDSAVPATPGASVLTVASGSVSLDWPDVADGALWGYNVYRGTVSGGPYTKLNVNPVGVSNFTDSTVAAGQTYYYVVRAIDTAGNESGSSTQASNASATPGMPDLAASRDSGTSTTDNITKFNNSTAALNLQFTIGSTINGATVKIYDGATLLGSVVATGTVTTVTTNGTSTLADGQHNIVATQTEPNKGESASVPLALTIDTLAPTADIVDVSPDPRNSPVSSIDINFNEPVTGFFISDLSLTRNGGSNLLGAQTLVNSGDNIHFTLNDLSSATAAAGNYLLSLLQFSVSDIAGNALAVGASDAFAVNVVNGDATPNANDICGIL